MALCKQLSFDPNLDIKKDPLQHSFSVPISFVPTARCVFYERYVNYMNSLPNINVTWEDETSQPVRNLEIPSSYQSLDTIPSNLPSDLYLSRARVFKGCVQLVVVTIYCTTGTVMVQGNESPEWRNQEYDTAVSCIDTIATQIIKGSASLTTMAADIHAHFPALDSAIGGVATPRKKKPTTTTPLRRSWRLRALSAVSEEAELDDDWECPGLSAASQSPPGPSGLLALPWVQTHPSPPPPPPVDTQSPGPSDLLALSSPHPSPPSLSPSVDGQTTVPADVEALSPPPHSPPPTSQPSTGSQSQEHTEVLTPSPLPQASPPAPQPASVEHDAPSTPPHIAPTPDHSSSPSHVSPPPTHNNRGEKKDDARDAKPSPKRRKLFPKARRSPFPHPVTVSQLRSALTLVVQDIVIRLGTLQEERISTSIQGVENKMTEKVEDSKTQTKNWIKVQLENAIERQNDQINTLSNKVKELENQNKKLKSTIGDLKQELNKSRPKVSVKSASVQTPQPQHPPAPNLNQPTTVSNLKPSSSSAPVVQSSQPEGTGTPATLGSDTSATTPSSSHASSPHNQPPPVPLKRLLQARVRPETTHLLVGDSVTQKLRPDWVFPDARHSQKISISGMGGNYLYQWLKSLPENRTVQSLVIHVGVNTCRDGKVITPNMWTALLNMAYTAFPEACIAFSSIVPPRSRRSPLAQNVAESNRNLHVSCSHTGAIFIDNYKSFTAPSGAPKQSMYYDNVHPSQDGTAQLGCNIKYSDVNQPPHPHSTQPPSARPAENPQRAWSSLFHQSQSADHTNQAQKDPRDASAQPGHAPSMATSPQPADQLSCSSERPASAHPQVPQGPNSRLSPYEAMLQFMSFMNTVLQQNAQNAPVSNCTMQHQAAF